MTRPSDVFAWAMSSFEVRITRSDPERDLKLELVT